MYKRFRLPTGEVVKMEYFFTPEYTGLDIYAMSNIRINEFITVGVHHPIKITRVE